MGNRDRDRDRTGPAPSFVKVLEVCCRIEEKCAALYRNFARAFANDPDLAALWNKTAREEDGHARNFRTAICQKGKAIGSNGNLDLRLVAIEQKIDDFITRISQLTPTITDALLFALYLEQNLSEYYLETAVAFDDPEIATLFKTMKDKDLDHVEMLRQHYENYRNGEH